MSFNSSVLRSVVPQFFASSNSSAEECLESTERTIIYKTYTFTNASLLPFYTYILFVGFQQWRRQRLTPTGMTTSHSDFFTYQMIVVEILGVLGSVLYVLGSYIRSKAAVLLGVFIFGIIFPGQSSFHVLTCVERYLAVVHAIKYMRLSETFKVRVRNISTVTVWLLCFGWLGILKLYLPEFPTKVFVFFVFFCLIIITFCCFSVLCFLRRPGPTEVNRNQRRADLSKLRAFNMIVAITVSMLLRILGCFVCFALTDIISIDLRRLCSLMDAGLWLNIPSSLVLPLLFLHKAGKLPCCRSHV